MAFLAQDSFRAANRPKLGQDPRKMELAPRSLPSHITSSGRLASTGTEPGQLAATERGMRLGDGN